MSPLDRLSQVRAPQACVSEYCEVCGDEITGECPANDLPDGYRYNVFRRYAGVCLGCRASIVSLAHGAAPSR